MENSLPIAALNQMIESAQAIGTGLIPTTREAESSLMTARSRYAAMCEAKEFRIRNGEHPSKVIADFNADVDKVFFAKWNWND